MKLPWQFCLTNQGYRSRVLHDSRHGDTVVSGQTAVWEVRLVFAAEMAVVVFECPGQPELWRETSSGHVENLSPTA